MLQQFLLGRAQGDLIADLIKVANGVGAFAVIAAHRQMQIFGRAFHALNFARVTQRRQVQHGSQANSTSDIGWTCGQVTPALVK